MTRKLGWVFAAIVVLAAVPAASGEALAAKNQKRYSIDAVQRALRFIDQLPTNAQRLTAEALQLALQIEPEHSYANFKRSHGQFETVLSTLNKGDEPLALPIPTDPKLLEPLRKLQAVWDELNDPIHKVLESGKVTRDDFVLLAVLNNQLIAASKDTRQAYQDVLLAKLPFTTALNNIVKAEQLSFLVERMTAEFLLIAYDHEASRQRRNLGESAAEFELILNGLMHGDPNLHLVPAQDPDIAAQLRKVEVIWLEVARTIKRTASTGETADPETLYRVTEYMEPLFAEMQRSADLLEKL